MNLYSEDSTALSREQFYTLLQFLAYVENLGYGEDSLGSTKYRVITFQIKQFLNYKKESDNYYQLKKIIAFFDEVQANSLVKYFGRNYYRGLVTVPQVKLEKAKDKSWVATVWVADELFYHSHPFFLPVEKKLTKHPLEVQFKVIQVCCSSITLEKVFHIKEFFDNYPAILSNQKKTKMKEFFIELIDKYQKAGIIESRYQVMENGQFNEIEKLTPKNISNGFIIYEKLNL